jgi:ribA/ribD-fused uncharacterized protein
MVHPNSSQECREPLLISLQAPIFFHKAEENPYGFFCQWYLAPFTFEGQEFNCAEQSFMWKKAKHFGDEASAREVLREKSPKKQKALGRAVRGFDETEWDKGESCLISKLPKGF